MRVGDLVKFKQNDTMGIILAEIVPPRKTTRDGAMFHVQWFDELCPKPQLRYDTELEVISGIS